MMSSGCYDVVIKVLRLTLQNLLISAEGFDQINGINYCYKCKDLASYFTTF